MLQNRRNICVLLISAAYLCLGNANAQTTSVRDYPSKAITMIVPFPPGGATDALARIVAQKLTTSLGQAVVVDNHPGAGGTIGAGLVARANPDGYTILFTSSSTHSVAPSFNKKLPYDAVTDFTPIGGAVASPSLLMVTKTLPIKTLKDLILYAKAHPGELNFASSGNGTVIQLNVEALKAQAGLDMTHVPYKGSALALPDLVSGKVHILFDVMVAGLQPVKDGKLNALAVGGTKRSTLLPDVPTVAEAGKKYGLGQFESSTWFGIFGPRNLAPEIVAKLNAALNKVIVSPDVVERFAQIGAEPMPGTPDKFATMVAKERVRWSNLIKQAQINAE
ncbi:tripartite tricarboxylate transporter substrate binding protein [Polynucleobacter sp. MWH-Braz-FAM2G]|uniref:Bug family tripartite tricarboxylate transporter substrate binding protein n=1 Tax=Polynucleobacter sp. MWH-Braz-FAM2G TaxID=1855883 RepID=UPI001BFE0623|nr:tripartite tricarboxylate transporter substrate binding protein [Polynucleobacter sp. MWH-Braz-FAM2G]QWD90080.1 tripartite tricarboxylate transporter substrate binding protein [Polynucleobacter sp. MWH-Braz-FAM2G]